MPRGMGPIADYDNTLEELSSPWTDANRRRMLQSQMPSLKSMRDFQMKKDAGDPKALTRDNSFGAQLKALGKGAAVLGGGTALASAMGVGEGLGSLFSNPFSAVPSSTESAGGSLLEGAGSEILGGGAGPDLSGLGEAFAAEGGAMDMGVGLEGMRDSFLGLTEGSTAASQLAGWPAASTSFLGPAANALSNVGDPTIDANAPTVDAGLSGNGGGSAIPSGLLGPIARILGMPTGDLAKVIAATIGGASKYFTGEQEKSAAREMIDLGAPERARFRSMTPGSFATEMNPVLEQLANARARQWSQQVGNPANSPQAMIATDQDMASTLFGAYNQERGMLANTGWGLASPMTGYRSLSDAGTRQAEGIGGAVGSVLDTIAGTPKRDPSADLLDLIRNNPGLFGGGS